MTRWRVFVVVQTSRRLPEAVLTGCIPVFFGPPFHTVPLADQLDYRSFAIFFNFTQPSSWNEGLPVRWTLDMSERAVAPVNSEFWVPDLPNILDFTINVPNAMVRSSSDALVGWPVRMITCNVDTASVYHNHNCPAA